MFLLVWVGVDVVPEDLVAPQVRVVPPHQAGQRLVPLGSAAVYLYGVVVFEYRFLDNCYLRVGVGVVVEYGVYDDFYLGVGVTPCMFMFQ